MWRSIWNGPFYIGKLERPVSVGDAIMKVLETVWRAAILVAGGFAAVVAFILFSSWQSGQAADRALGSTVIDARADFVKCTNSHPIRITISNNGSKTLVYVSYDVKIMDPIRNVDVAPAEFGLLSYSEPLKPNHRMEVCLSPYSNYGAATYLTLRPDMRVQGVLDFVSVQ